MSMLEQRKVTKVGYSTIAITIPKKWAERLNIKPGSTVTLLFDENAQSIIIKKDDKPKTGSNVLIEYSDIEELLYKIKGGYISGIDKMIIFDKNNVKDNKINHLVEKLPGLLILSDTEHTIIRIALLDDIIDIDDIIRRMKNIILATFNNIIEYLRKDKRELVDKTLTLYEEIDKMYILGLRYLNRTNKQLVNKAQVMSNYMYSAIILEKLRNIEGVLYRITETILNDVERREIARNYIELLEESKCFLINATEALTAYNTFKIRAAVKQWKHISETIKKMREIKEVRELGFALEELNNIINSLLEIIIACYFRSKHLKNS